MSVVSGGLQSGGGAAVLLLPNATGTTLTLSGALISSSVTVGNGTSAAPTVNFAGETTLGIFRSAATLLGVAGALDVGPTLDGTDRPIVQYRGGTAFGIFAAGSGTTLRIKAGGANYDYTSTNLALPGTLTIGSSLGGFTAAGSLRSGATAIPDASGTPGNATQNTPRGRAAFAGAASTCVITNSEVTADSVVMVVLETATDATLTFVRGVVPTAGSFTVTGNAAATGTVIFRWFIVK